MRIVSIATCVIACNKRSLMRLPIILALLLGLIFVFSACSKNSGNKDNLAPTFMSEDRAVVHEGNRVTNFSVQALDQDGDALIYSITGGQDGLLFTVDASSGELEFVEAPIHRSPKDGNRDNEYLVDVTAVDGRGGNAVTRLKVRVIPSITSPLASISEPEMPFGSGGDAPIKTHSPHSLAKNRQPKSDNGSLMMSVTLDERNNRAYVVDWNYLSLMSIDLISGARAVVSSREVGLGEAFISPKVVDLDHGQERALVVDVGRGALMAVDLKNGNRRIISDDETGSGTPFVLPGSVSTDPGDSRVLVVDWSLQAIFEVDLLSGDRVLISGGSVGEGIPFKSPYAAALDAENNRVFVVDKDLALIIVVDLVTGDRAVLSGAGVGSGIAFKQPYGIVHQPQRGRILVVDSGHDAVVAVDAKTGNRAVVAGGEMGSGPAFDDPRSISLRRHSNRALVVDWGVRALYEVDLATGNRLLVSGKYAQINNLPAGGARQALVKSLPAPRNSAVREAAEVPEVESGRENSHPKILALNAPAELVLNEDGLIAYVFDAMQRAIYSVSLLSGEKKLISSKARGQGEGFGTFVKMAYVESGQSLLVLDIEHKALVRVLLSTGDREIVSNQNRGGGAEFKAPMDLKFDAKTGRAFIIDPEQKAIIAVSVASGDRMLLPLN